MAKLTFDIKYSEFCPPRRSPFFYRKWVNVSLFGVLRTCLWPCHEVRHQMLTNIDGSTWGNVFTLDYV